MYCTVLYCTVPAVGVGAALGALGVVSDPAAAVDDAGVLASPRSTRVETIAPTLFPPIARASNEMFAKISQSRRRTLAFVWTFV